MQLTLCYVNYRKMKRYIILNLHRILTIALVCVLQFPAFANPLLPSQASAVSTDFSTYFGANGEDFIFDMINDNAGNIIIAGYTAGNLPTTPGAYDTTHNGGLDVFVAKLSPNGQTLIYSTYLGGSGNDSGYALDIDSIGNPILVGPTRSSNFPTTPGAFDTTFSGPNDTFMAKLSADGTSLLYSSYLTGSFNNDVGTDSSDNVVVATSDGTNTSVTKYSVVGTPIYSINFVGGFDISTQPLLVDDAGNSYLTGATSNSGFPTTPGAYDTSFNGSVDAFIVKVSPTGSVMYSTFLGGSNLDQGRSLALESNNNLLVLGRTGSSNFPTTPGVYDTGFNGELDAFVAKLSSDGSTLLSSTYFGGSLDDRPYDIEFDINNNIHIVGLTNSEPFPVTPGSSCNNSNLPDHTEIFLAKLSADSSELIYSTLYGEANDSSKMHVSVDNANNALIAGTTESANYPTTPGAFDQNYNGSTDGFVTKISMEPVTCNQPPTADANGPYIVNEGEAVTLTGSGVDPDNDPLTYAWDLDNNGTFETMEQNPTYTAGEGPSIVTVHLQVCDDSNSCDIDSATITITVQEPVTVSFGASADTYLQSGQANRNKGGGEYVQIQSSGNNRALLRFDQNELQNEIEDGEIISAKIRLSITETSSNWGPTGRTIDLHRLISGWTEGNGTESDRGTGEGATWSCATDSDINNLAKNCSGVTEWEMGQPNNPEVHPWIQTASATQTITSNQTGVVEFDVTDDLTAFLNGTNTNYGWILKKTEEGQSGQVSFATRESANTPQLIVTYQP
jgi:hypothetical protein